MKANDRDYFLLRARQENEAAARSTGAVRGRHEELASIYRMRVMYIDRGLFGDEPETKEPEVETAPVPHIIVAA